MSESYYNIVAVILFFVGVVSGSVLQDAMSSPVITEQRASIHEQAHTIHQQREALLVYVNEVGFFKEKVERLREAQESSNNLLMKVEDFYKLDFEEARKGGGYRIEKLIAQRVEKFNGMGGN